MKTDFTYEILVTKASNDENTSIAAVVKKFKGSLMQRSESELFMVHMLIPFNLKHVFAG